MGLLDDVKSQIDKTVKSPMDITTRPSTSVDKSVPEPGNLSYNSGRVITATYLYTDMHGSSSLAAIASREQAARVFRGYLNVSTKIIRSLDGHIRSFDGDRVMGIFTGPNKEDRAVKAAMRIKWAVEMHVTPAIYSQFPSLKDKGWSLKQSSGIATSEALLARAGFRDNDDMISIGVAPNMAAKLSDIRKSGDDARFVTRIGKGTYSNLSDECRLSTGKNMWQGTYELTMGGKKYDYYRSSYHWAFFVTNPDPVETAWRIHAAVVDWTGKVDSKASFTLTIETAIMAGIIAMSTDNRVLADLNGVKEISYTVGVLLVGLAMLFSAAVVAPRLRRVKKLKAESATNFVYFGHLRHLDPADIEHQILQADLLPVLSHQLQKMSNIAWWKHRFAQVSMALAVIGIIPIVIVALV